MALSSQAAAWGQVPGTPGMYRTASPAGGPHQGLGGALASWFSWTTWWSPLGMTRVICTQAPMPWLWGSLGTPPLSWPHAGHSSYRLGASVLSKQMPWLLCSREPWAPRVSGGTSPPSGLHASGLRTSTEGLSWLGARPAWTAVSGLGGPGHGPSLVHGPSSLRRLTLCQLWVPLGSVEVADLGHL